MLIRFGAVVLILDLLMILAHFEKRNTLHSRHFDPFQVLSTF